MPRRMNTPTEIEATNLRRRSRCSRPKTKGVGKIENSSESVLLERRSKNIDHGRRKQVPD